MNEFQLKKKKPLNDLKTLAFIISQKKNCRFEILNETITQVATLSLNRSKRTGSLQKDTIEPLIKGQSFKLFIIINYYCHYLSYSNFLDMF